jgi:hypothetical protein
MYIYTYTPLRGQWTRPVCTRRCSASERGSWSTLFPGDRPPYRCVCCVCAGCVLGAGCWVLGAVWCVWCVCSVCCVLCTVRCVLCTMGVRTECCVRTVYCVYSRGPITVKDEAHLPYTVPYILY